MGSSCLWPNHIPGLGATRLPAPFRAPFSDPDQLLVCTSSQGLLVRPDLAPVAVAGPRWPSQGSWLGPSSRVHLEGDLGVGRMRPHQTPSLMEVKPMCALHVTPGPVCHWAIGPACVSVWSHAASVCLLVCPSYHYSSVWVCAPALMWGARACWLCGNACVCVSFLSHLI